MSTVSISVVIPVRDGARYLATALTSVLAQSLPPAEVIVIDDGSRDQSERLARAFGEPVRVFSQPPLGIGSARNRGVALANGEAIAFLDADDRMPERALEVRAEALGAEPAPDLVWGMASHFHSPELDVRTARRLPPVPGTVPAHLPGGLLATRAALEVVGPFDCTLPLGEFVDWIARAHELGLREATVPDVVLHRRVHAANHTLLHGGDLVELTRVLRRALERRRLSSLAEP